MPELPEVELVARYLRPRLLGRRIAHVFTAAQSYFFLAAPALLKKRLPGETIEALERQGKYLLLGLASGHRLLLHLGMTGQLIMDGAKSPRLAKKRKSVVEPGRSFVRDGHTHLVLEFDDGGSPLYFRDTRKFGKVQWLERGSSDPRLDKLGPDALKVTSAVLFDASRKRRAKVKSLLLDQTVTAGIGNIYADESLFQARIHPERPACDLDPDDCQKLAQIIRHVLKHSIRAGGSSIDDYIHPDGSDGGFQHKFHVYGREGQPCHACKTSIARVVIGQRSSHFCPKCQKR